MNKKSNRLKICPKNKKRLYATVLPEDMLISSLVILRPVLAGFPGQIQLIIILFLYYKLYYYMYVTNLRLKCTYIQTYIYVSQLSFISISKMNMC